METKFISDDNLDAVTSYTGAVPGQSLTNNPDQKYPWEQPPTLVNRREAELYALEELTEKDKFIKLTDAISDGVPIDVLTRTYLLSGYSRGLWDVDLMLLLVESVGFIIMALAEKVGLDYELYAGDNEEDVKEEDQQLEKINETTDVVRKGLSKISIEGLKKPTMQNKELQEKIEEIPQETIEEVKGLLARPNQEEKNNKSLLEA
tara:strand:+ start:1980 stop:2594 length:615 start_codon:yes stop_codon:yes gene_type:complete